MPKSNFKIDELALVLIVAIAAMIVSIYDKSNKNMGIEAERIAELILDNHELSFAHNGIIDENKLQKIQLMDYSTFKKSIDAKKDFCISVEDENGNVIFAKGSARLNGNGLHCRE
ncbi:MAG: hypothetical protein AABX33_02255 [Nanoarchaeota archaeon]